MSKVAIVGSGFIGRAWAITYARAGQQVVLWDSDSAAAGNAKQFIEMVLPDLQDNDLLNGREPAEILADIDSETDLGNAVSGAVHIQENAPERLDVKKQL